MVIDIIHFGPNEFRIYDTMSGASAHVLEYPYETLIDDPFGLVFKYTGTRRGWLDMEAMGGGYKYELGYTPSR